MTTIKEGKLFQQSINNFSGDKVWLSFRIRTFILWKANVEIPIKPFNWDKSSSVNDKGEVFQPYKLNQVRHCRLKENGRKDPIIAYRILPNGNILLLGITNHFMMFTKRNEFVNNHKEEIPEELQRLKVLAGLF